MIIRRMALRCSAMSGKCQLMNVDALTVGASEGDDLLGQVVAVAVSSGGRLGSGSWAWAFVPRLRHGWYPVSSPLCLVFCLLCF